MINTAQLNVFQKIHRNFKQISLQRMCVTYTLYVDMREIKRLTGTFPKTLCRSKNRVEYGRVSKFISISIQVRICYITFLEEYEGPIKVTTKRIFWDIIHVVRWKSTDVSEKHVTSICTIEDPLWKVSCLSWDYTGLYSSRQNSLYLRKLIPCNQSEFSWISMNIKDTRK
jgi:hypothetical protein